MTKGKVQKKNKEKKLTSVSFAITHTYPPVKTNIFRFFPNRTWKILKNVQNGQHGHTGRGVGVLTAPCDQDTTPYGSKPLL